VLVTLFFDNPKAETHRPLDWIGFVLTAAALFCMMYGIEAIGRGGSEFTQMIVLLVLGVVLGALALRHLLRSSHPLLDLSVFRIATFRASISGGSLFRAGAGTLVFLLPLLLQIVFGLSAFFREHYFCYRRRVDVDEGDGTAYHQMLRLPQSHSRQRRHRAQWLIYNMFMRRGYETERINSIAAPTDAPDTAPMAPILPIKREWRDASISGAAASSAGLVPRGAHRLHAALRLPGASLSRWPRSPLH
jgi:hypothetical protein